jgi:L-seryl-tRNA(Ser) seleniumtransferase
VVRATVATAQQAARAGDIPPEDVLEAAVRSLPASACSLRPVLNATGIIVHTNLGRAPLSAEARQALLCAAGATDVELDLETGRRGQRGAAALAALRQVVPDAGNVHIVNNGAAALLLAATVLAGRREIVVSRGELVEIGDGFRIPDLLETTGARLREVGTTNRTALADYAAAIGEETGTLLKVHPSNFRMEGFVSGVAVHDLAGLAAAHRLPLVVDIGSGLLRRDASLPDEPDAATTLQAGATLVTASADKLLGGPQAGLIMGDAATVQRLRRHPMARALRVDKLTLAALEATLRGPATPVMQALHRNVESLRRRTEVLAKATSGVAVPSDGAVGGGGAPGQVLAGWAVALPESLAGPLRRGDPSVVGRIESGRLLLDLRCIPEEHDAAIRDAVAAAFASTSPS